MAHKSVALVPFISNQNHYSSLVSATLEMAGFDIVPVVPSRLSPFAIYDDPSVDIVIIYWPHLFYTGKNIFSTSIKLLATLVGLRKLQKKPTIYSLENFLPHDASHSFIHTFIISSILKKSKMVICTSEGARDKFIDYFPSHTGIPKVIIPHPSYGSVYQSIMKADDEFRAQYNIKPGESVCLFFGLLRPYKGLTSLIDCFAQVATESTRLLICGKPYSPAALRSIEKEIHLLPSRIRKQITLVPRFIQDEDVPTIFGLADFLACSYVAEPANPGAPILALHFGKPVYGAHNGVIPSIVGYENMYAYKPHSRSSRVQTLREAFCDADRNEKAARLKELDQTRHSLRSLAPKFLALIEEL